MGWFDGIFDTVKDVLGVVTDIGDTASPYVSAYAQYQGSKEQQEASQEFAREQMAFQERMSSSAHQREVDDLRAAGLNPILSSRLGGSSSPSGAMGTAQNIVGSAVEKGVQTGFQARQVRAQLDNVEEDTKKKFAERVLTEELKHKAYADTLVSQREAENKHVVRGILESEAQSAKAAASRDKTTEEFFETDIGKWIRKFGLAGKELNPFLGAGNSARNLLKQ